jgi:putative spermidine/putrescine transport system permease protein
VSALVPLPWRVPALVWTLAVTTLVLVLLPLAVVCLMAFSPSEMLNFPPTGLSLRWFEAFFTSDSYITALVHVSLPLGLIAAALATVFGTLAALALSRLEFRGRAALQVAILSPLFIPHILLGASFYVVFAHVVVLPGLLPLVASHVVITLPYVVRTVSAGLAGVDRRLEEAAIILGASRMQAFIRVTIPVARLSILSGALFAFVVSFSDVNVSLFVAGPGLATLPVQIYSQLQFESDPTIAAASAVQIALIAVVLLMLRPGSRR